MFVIELNSIGEEFRRKHLKQLVEILKIRKMVPKGRGVEFLDESSYLPEKEYTWLEKVSIKLKEMEEAFAVMDDDPYNYNCMIVPP